MAKSQSNLFSCVLLKCNLLDGNILLAIYVSLFWNLKNTTIYFNHYLFCFILVTLSVVGLYFVICYITTKSDQYKQDVNQLIENTIILLKERAKYEPDENFIPIIHIRDCLIPVKERQGRSL